VWRRRDALLAGVWRHGARIAMSRDYDLVSDLHRRPPLIELLGALHGVGHAVAAPDVSLTP
jgi:hypothetical protein